MGDNSRSEIAIFREFAEVCPLRIDATSIEKRPDGTGEPDILCSVETGEWIAFELVEVVDNDLAAASNEGIRLPRLLKKHAPRLPGLEFGARVGVIFGDGLSERQKINLFPLLFEKLKSIPTGFAGELRLPLEIQRKGLHGIAIYRGLADELEFIVTPATSIGDPTLERLRDKLARPYTSPHPMELLLYFLLQPCFVDGHVGLDLAGAVADGVHSSPFRRVWVFDRSSKRVWVYP